ncbi:MAG: hypothetical protein HETSPECPRED_002752 [Heterodermia speciosa]|uniref:Cytochrome P450 n=1 Tax=Heterodermia speciosa TaxID=116794 RepID=A0A8H3IHQ6_9LECA|nr:MAG: hypothetical protein HETSPECPRED_002752 [Heterodermia speciosa]
MYNIPLLALVCGFLFSIYRFIVYPTFLSPLARIPNSHFTASFSPLWILWKRYRGAENKAIHDAHVKYGPIVRVGPNDIDVNCVEGGIKTIASFEKPNWYPNAFMNFGVTNMFSMTGSKQHSIRKRIISNIYSKSYLQSSDELHRIANIIIYTRYLPVLDSLAKARTSVDVHELNFAVTMDNITAYIFGLCNGSNFIQDIKARKHFLQDYHCRRPYQFYGQELPGLTKMLSRIGIRLVPKWSDEATQRVENFCLQMCNAARASIESNTTPSSENTPTVYKHLYHSLSPKSDQPPSSASPDSNLLIASEIFDHIAAGHETSGVALTYAIYSLSQHPTLQASLRAELLTLSPPIIYSPSSQTQTSLPSPRSIDTLPLLHAILMETLRLYAPIPGPQPRITPHTPASLANSLPLPPNIRVSAQAYSLHRNPTVFPSPENWDPSRWTSASKPELEEMNRWFWAFGSGGRMCVGSKFAMQEMKLLLATIYSGYRTSLVDASGIAMKDTYTSGPEGGRLIVRFEYASESAKS